MIFLYFPLLYLVHTRIKHTSEKLSWFIIYLLPILILNFNINDKSTVIFTILTVLFVYLFYEIGYIFNDAFLIKNEEKPTLRLSIDEINYINTHILKILFIRFTLGILLLVAFYYYQLNIIPAILSSIAILTIYYFYNKTRSNISFPLYYLLISLRFFTPFLIIGTEIPFWMFFMQPLLATLEYAGKKSLFRSAFTNFISKKDLYRAIWYFSILMLYIFYCFYRNDISISLALVIGMYFFFRASIYIHLSKNIK